MCLSRLNVEKSSGSSGRVVAGKSRLVQILPGLLQFTDGAVTADGQDIAAYDLEDWARRITFVPQEPMLYSRSIAESIKFFRPIGTGRIVIDARLAQLDSEISAMVDGYEYQVAEKGSRPSGGQRQRVCRARALVEALDFLVLDEPSSALDGRNEPLISESPNALKGTCAAVTNRSPHQETDVVRSHSRAHDGAVPAFPSTAELAVDPALYSEVLRLAEHVTGGL